MLWHLVINNYFGWFSGMPVPWYTPKRSSSVAPFPINRNFTALETFLIKIQIQFWIVWLELLNISLVIKSFDCVCSFVNFVASCRLLSAAVAVNEIMIKLVVLILISLCITNSLLRAPLPIINVLSPKTQLNMLSIKLINSVE